uniref:Uncharacterized protein n=1 Tax=Haptolina brevifila TaxID=156173 RepID=A0A7S2N9D2_9EUKA
MVPHRSFVAKNKLGASLGCVPNVHAAARGAPYPASTCWFALTMREICSNAVPMRMPSITAALRLSMSRRACVMNVQAHPYLEATSSLPPPNSHHEMSRHRCTK